ncbi:MAG: sulfurtransferase TusA family protein [Candidatus Aenigmatarchaeota archaeon]
MKRLDCRGLKCPFPLLKVRENLLGTTKGDLIEILADDPLSKTDIPLLCEELGCELKEVEEKGEFIRFIVVKRI